VLHEEVKPLHYAGFAALLLPLTKGEGGREGRKEKVREDVICCWCPSVGRREGRREGGRRAEGLTYVVDFLFLYLHPELLHV